MVAKQVRKMYYILLTLPWKQRVLGLIPKETTYLLLTQIWAKGHMIISKYTVKKNYTLTSLGLKTD